MMEIDVAPQRAAPFCRHLDFLPADWAEGLLDWAIGSARRFVPATITTGIVVPAIRSALSLRDLGPFSTSFEAHARAMTPSWIEALQVPSFTVSRVELELVAYNDGAHFRMHTDTQLAKFRTQGDRMLSLVYYFHRMPKAFQGGELRLHRFGAQPGDAGHDIAPDQNSAVIFPSWAPHEVRPIICPSGAFENSRFAVNCWGYRNLQDVAPKEETGK